MPLRKISSGNKMNTISSILKACQIPILCYLLCVSLYSCKIGQALEDFNKVSTSVESAQKDVNEITDAILPVDSLMMTITSGLLSELSSSSSEEKLDSISARINRILVQYLNETFQSLDPGPIGEKAVTGALDTLLAEQTRARIQQFIAALSSQLSQEITGLITDITSAENKARLSSLLTSLFSEENSTQLSSFINESLRKIEFDSLGNQIAYELIDQNINPSIDSLVRTAVKGIFDEIQNDDNAKGFFGDLRHILFLAFGLLGLIIGIFFWWTRRKSNNLNRVLINAIEDLDDKAGKEVKKLVEKKARNEGLLPDLDKVLEQEHLFTRQERTLVK